MGRRADPGTLQRKRPRGFCLFVVFCLFFLPFSIISTKVSSLTYQRFTYSAIVRLPSRSNWTNQMTVLGERRILAKEENDQYFYSFSPLINSFKELKH